jgi:hypothetical protein
MSDSTPPAGDPRQPWNPQPYGPAPTAPMTGGPVPPDGPRRGKWTRKRILIPAAALIFLIGILIGTAGSGSDDSATVAGAKAAPAPTITVTATPAAKAAAAPKPAPTVTVTKTVQAKAPAAPKKTKAPSAPDGQAVFKVWGSAPAGVDITYGSDSDNIQGHGLPMTKTLSVKDDALYYDVTAQLQGGGDIHCSVTIGSHTKTGHASGGYNICQVQLNEDFLGGFS